VLLWTVKMITEFKPGKVYTTHAHTPFLIILNEDKKLVLVWLTGSKDTWTVQKDFIDSDLSVILNQWGAREVGDLNPLIGYLKEID
jgi:hypothetical protein